MGKPVKGDSQPTCKEKINEKLDRSDMITLMFFVIKITVPFSKCLAVHMNYKNPQEGARLMYETIEKYLQEVVLARPVQKLSPLEEERVHHDAFRVSRLAMGGVFVGGDDYLSRLDNHVKSQSTEESPKYLVVTGDAGKIMY